VTLLTPSQNNSIKLGLERIYALLAKLGNPHHQVPIVHVAGTNGKGSVCAYVSSVLTEAGYRTGRYTSPHLIDWVERICINECPISSDDLSNLVAKVNSVVTTEGEAPTLFELITTVAWLYFAQEKVDIAVIEVGLGGRLDATNVIDKPLVSVITSIGKDHWQILGSTLGKIAGEKAGILKPGCPVVMGILPEEADCVVRSRIMEQKCPAIYPQPSIDIGDGWAEYTNQEATPKSIKYPLVLQGQIQLANSALAIAALEILRKSGWEKITEEAIINGMGKTKWPGRMQWTTWKDKKLLLDGAHNPPAAKILRNYIDYLISNQLNNQSQVTWVIGMLGNKDHREIFEELLRPLDSLYLLPVPDENSALPEDLASLAREVCPSLSFCGVFPDLPTVLEAATNGDNLVALCGSLYLVGHFLGSQNS
jgi:dihydrofolate synthase / folylpolyglutamate synthase